MGDETFGFLTQAFFSTMLLYGRTIQRQNMAKGNRALNQAKSAKKDEFYTQLADIEKELKHYLPHFKDKIVLCNCDDPERSMFWRYFQDNFETLGLKALMSTHLSAEGSAYAMTETDNETFIYDMKGNGDFRSDEALDYLKKADIVVTNPPFSLFNDFVKLLTDYGKDYLIIGNQNALTYKHVFPMLRDNKAWIGSQEGCGSQWFEVPKEYKFENTSAFKVIDDKHYYNMSSTVWLTNLSHDDRPEPLWLDREYNEEDYPKYDNYDAIEVSRVANIPHDYDGVMGVPVTFLLKYNPEQFEIIGCDESNGRGFSQGLWKKDSKVGQVLLNGRRIYSRIFIKKKPA